ncbi:hypothetical protein ACOZ4N_00800 (plasmid) [Halorientalis pallida]|uniref:hypothetical protein n=1 Tax=Halorientalis pallida TaxID=2479928 RepID=UPI003C6FF976
MPRELAVGETVRLDQTTRRRFLKMLGIGSVGITGLQAALENAYGEEPEGVPLVLTKDRQGQPEKVKIIEEERHNKIQKYKRFSNKVRSEKIGRMSLKSRSDSRGDLKIKVTMSKRKNPDKGKNPSINSLEKSIQNNKPDQIPVEINKKVIDGKKHACGSRGDDRSTMEGGIGISTYPSSTSGTLGLVCYGDGTNTLDNVLITADHVMEGDSDMYQVDSTSVGSFSARDQSEDITAYEFNWDSDVTLDNGGVLGAPDVTGTWTWDGLLEYTITGTIDVTLSGRSSCTEDNMVTDVATNGYHAEHQVNMNSAVGQSGDSGGPWVDDDGKLVAFHSGVVHIKESIFGTILDKWDAGPAAEKALEAVGAQLQQPI